MHAGSITMTITQHAKHTWLLTSFCNNTATYTLRGSHSILKTKVNKTEVNDFSRTFKAEIYYVEGQSNCTIISTSAQVWFTYAHLVVLPKMNLIKAASNTNITVTSQCSEKSARAKNCKVQSTYHHNKNIFKDFKNWCKYTGGSVSFQNLKKSFTDFQRCENFQRCAGTPTLEIPGLRHQWCNSNYQTLPDTCITCKYTKTNTIFWLKPNS